MRQVLKYLSVVLFGRSALLEFIQLHLVFNAFHEQVLEGVVELVFVWIIDVLEVVD